MRHRFEAGREGRSRDGLESALAILVFVLSVGLGSVVKLDKLGGPWLVAAYAAVLCAALQPAVRARLAHIELGETAAAALAFAMLVALAVAFPLVRPHFDLGSDRDDALDLACRELLAGRYPYAKPVPRTGNPISPMPGELLLSAPFVAVLGTAATQSFFWLGAFVVLARSVLGSTARAMVCLAGLFALAPATVHEVLTAGDWLPMSLAILTFGAMAVGSERGWKPLAASALAGVAMSSRMQCALLVLPGAVWLRRRYGLRATAVRTATTIGAWIMVTAPFVLRDPARFPPFYTTALLRLAAVAGVRCATIAAIATSIAAAA